MHRTILPFELGFVTLCESGTYNLDHVQFGTLSKTSPCHKEKLSGKLVFRGIVSEYIFRLDINISLSLATRIHQSVPGGGLRMNG